MIWLAILISILIAAPLAAMAANVALHWDRTKPQSSGTRRIAPRLSVRGLIDEAAATLLLFLGPLAALLPQQQPAGVLDRGTLAILHDPGISTAASWLLVRRLKKAGWRIIRAPGSRAATAETVDRVAQSLLENAGPDEVIILIGIGSSGLLARQLAAHNPRFQRVLTIATPHQGTVSRAMPAALRPQSAYLEIVAQMDAQPRRFDAIAIYSDGDGWLEPSDAAYYPGAFNVEVHDIGHLSMLFSKRVFGYIDENLVAALPADLR